MSVVGIDFGAQSTKIGVARNKGIDIVSGIPLRPSFLSTVQTIWAQLLTIVMADHK